MIASFSALGVDLPSIALIVIYSFFRICFVIQRLPKLSPLLSFMFVRCSGTGSVLIRCRPYGTWCDAALRIMARKIFSPFWQSVGSRLLLSLSSISLLYRSQFVFFMLMLVRCCIGVIVTSICKLMRIGRWSEPRFVFVCQLVEVIREADANETSGDLGLALPGNLVGES